MVELERELRELDSSSSGPNRKDIYTSTSGNIREIRGLKRKLLQACKQKEQDSYQGKEKSYRQELLP